MSGTRLETSIYEDAESLRQAREAIKEASASKKASASVSTSAMAVFAPAPAVNATPNDLKKELHGVGRVWVK